MSEDAHLEHVRVLMRATLQAAIPMWIERLRVQPWETVQARAHEASTIVASQGDIIQFKSKEKGATARAFNALAEGLAALSFCPGGVKFLGDHWIAEHPEGVRQHEGASRNG